MFSKEAIITNSVFLYALSHSMVLSNSYQTPHFYQDIVETEFYTHKIDTGRQDIRDKYNLLRGTKNADRQVSDSTDACVIKYRDAYRRNISDVV